MSMQEYTCAYSFSTHVLLCLLVSSMPFATEPLPFTRGYYIVCEYCIKRYPVWVSAKGDYPERIHNQSHRK